MTKTLTKYAALLIATLLCSCSAEWQLARLLRKHPELAHDSVSVRVHEVIQPAQSGSLYIQDIRTIEPQVLHVECPRAYADLAINPDGSADLSVTAPPDTVVITDTVKTRVIEYVQKEDKQKYKWYFFLFFMGAALSLVTVVALRR